MYIDNLLGAFQTQNFPPIRMHLLEPSRKSSLSALFLTFDDSVALYLALLFTCCWYPDVVQLSGCLARCYSRRDWAANLAKSNRQTGGLIRNMEGTQRGSHIFLHFIKGHLFAWRRAVTNSEQNSTVHDAGEFLFGVEISVFVHMRGEGYSTGHCFSLFEKIFEEVKAKS